MNDQRKHTFLVEIRPTNSARHENTSIITDIRLFERSDFKRQSQIAEEKYESVRSTWHLHKRSKTVIILEKRCDQIWGASRPFVANLSKSSGAFH